MNSVLPLPLALVDFVYPNAQIIMSVSSERTESGTFSRICSPIKGKKKGFALRLVQGSKTWHRWLFAMAAFGGAIADGDGGAASQPRTSPLSCPGLDGDSPFLDRQSFQRRKREAKDAMQMASEHGNCPGIGYNDSWG